MCPTDTPIQPCLRQGKRGEGREWRVFMWDKWIEMRLKIPLNLHQNL